MNFDLIVIGTGTAAMVAARRVRSAGWTVAVIDEKPFGDTCARFTDPVPDKHEHQYADRAGAGNKS